MSTGVVRPCPFRIPMMVTQLPGEPRERRFVRLSGVCVGGRWGVHNHNRTNVVRGLIERVFAVETSDGLRSTPKPVSGVFNNLSGFRSRLVRKLVSCTPWTSQEFLDSYNGSKKLSYERAMSSLSLRPLQRTDGWLSTFVKAEKLNLSKKPDPAPRVIQPRNARYNCIVGPYLKPLEHRLYKAIGDIYGSPTVMKGFDAVAQGTILRAKWDRHYQPVAIGLDASRFDQHVSVGALQWEHSCYNQIYRDERLQELLQWQIHNTGVAFTPDGKVKYSVEGCRMSGDMNTAMGNCLIMCALIHRLLEERGIDGDLVNNGDDCVIIVGKADLPRLISGITNWFLRYGFNMKVEEPVETFELIEFCQTHPVFDGLKWRMVRDPRVCLDKDGINLRPGNIPERQWFGTVGECGLALTSGLPVLQSYYKYLTRIGTSGGPTEATGMSYLRGKLVSKEAEITTLARVSFWRAFGIPPHQQVAIERELDGIAGYVRGGLMFAEVQSSIILQL